MTMQPQSFLPPGEAPGKAAILLNFYEDTESRYHYFVTHVDGKKIGNAWQGSGAVFELHLPEGKHKLTVVLGTYGNSVLGNRAFSGDIECDLTQGGIYTIDYQSHLGNPSERYTLPVECIAHRKKPENKTIEKNIKNGGKWLPDFYKESSGSSKQ